jgi:hypothetical protein
MQSSDGSDDERELYGAAEGMPRYNPQPKQASDAESKRFSEVLASWPVSAGVCIFFCFDLPRVLQSAVPWSALVYPGFFIAMSFWSVVRHFADWKPPEHTLAWALPLPTYMVLSTITMFAFFAATDEPFYRTEALGSMILSIPFGALAILVIFKRGSAPEN